VPRTAITWTSDHDAGVAGTGTTRPTVMSLSLREAGNAISIWMRTWDCVTCGWAMIRELEKYACRYVAGSCHPNSLAACCENSLASNNMLRR